MAFLKSSQITGLSAKDVDVRGFTQADSINLDGSYTEHEVLLADAYNIKGNVTVSDNLILSKLSDDGDDITITGDTTTRTITGSGSIEGATLAQTPNSTLEGMTGTLGSGVTLGSGATIGAEAMSKGSIVQTEIDVYHKVGAHWYSGAAADTYLPTPLNLNITRKLANSYFHVIFSYPNLYLGGSHSGRISIFEDGLQAISADQGMYVKGGMYSGDASYIEIISTTSGAIGDVINFRVYGNPKHGSQNIYFHVHSYGTLTCHEFIPTDETVTKVAAMASIEGVGS